MKSNQRREFLKKSLLGLSGAALIPGSLKAAINVNIEQAEIPVLPSRILGSTGIKTPLISMGTGPANNPNFIKSAYYAGVKLFFSATYYGEGNNEKLVGEGLKGLPRDSFVIGTAAPPDGMDTRTGNLTTPLDVNAYIQKAEVSLDRFGLDYVDIFLFPYAGKRDVMLNESLLKALQELKKKGKTKFLGIATHSNIEEALRAAADSKIYDVVMPAYNYKVKNKEAMNEALLYASKAGVGIVAMKTTAGAFSDKTRTSPLNSDAALKWVLQNESITSIVSGMSSLEELQKNIAMIKNLKMSDQELKDLNLTELNTEPGLYCYQCRKCVPQCRYNLEIPTVMRSYMYAYGYRDMGHAQHTLMEADLPVNSCKSCENCSVKCSAGFNVKEKIMDISRLKDVPREFLIS
ncbi:MAG: aldo/keto reductase [Bacteroidales bacterium]|nr:aldo/keto reductase [Bacteroidales bacterium]